MIFPQADLGNVPAFVNSASLIAASLADVCQELGTIIAELLVETWRRTVTRVTSQAERLQKKTQIEGESRAETLLAATRQNPA